MTQLKGFVEKGWGHENIFATNEKYCGKLLVFNEGSRFSMHFHAEKDETWFVLEGIFDLLTIETDTATVKKERLVAGDTKRIKPLTPHQLICVKKGTIIEVSTPDSVEDNYRVGKGNSQGFAAK
jgi:mannose-6-phosphate isomerase-like protein (cupin superfamily)